MVDTNSKVARVIANVGETPTDDNTFDIIAAFRLVWHRKWGVLFFATAIGLIASLYAYSLEPVYQSEATILVNLETSSISPVNNVLNSDALSQYYRSLTYFDTQIRLINSKALATKVVERLELWNHPEFDPRQAAPRRAKFQLDFSWRDLLPGKQKETKKVREYDLEELKKIAIAGVRWRIQATRIKDTDILNLTFTLGDAELATTIVNTYADAYIEMGLESRLAMVKKASEWLTDKIEDLKQEVNYSEQKLQEYRDSEGFAVVGSTVDLAGQQLDSLSKKLIDAKANLSALESLSGQMQDLQSLSDAELLSHPAIVNNQLVQSKKVRESQALIKLQELSVRYGNKHPKIKAAKLELETARTDLNQDIRRIVSSGKQEIEAARKNVEILEQRVAESKKNVQRVNRKEFSLKRLERDVEANRQLYGLFLTRFKETDLGTDVNSTKARVIDKAEGPGMKISPNQKKIIMTWVIVAMMIAVSIVFLLEKLDATIKTGDEVESELAVPMLGSLPILKIEKKDQFHPERQFIREPKSVFAEAMRTIRTGVILSGIDRANKKIVVTSTIPGEGKTTVSINMAIAFGHLEKVLLIDADMRRASLAQHFGLTRDLPGLSNWVAATSDLEECIHTFEDENIDVMTAGVIPANPLELLSSKRFHDCLEILCEKYDRLIIDSAPAQAVSDPVVLSTHSDSVVYVVKADSTPAPLCQAGLKKLRTVDAPIIGAILNQQDARKSIRYYGSYGKYGRYGYHYDRYYQYDYYGPKETKDDKG